MWNSFLIEVLQELQMVEFIYAEGVEVDQSTMTPKYAPIVYRGSSKLQPVPIRHSAKQPFTGKFELVVCLINQRRLKIFSMARKG